MHFSYVTGKTDNFITTKVFSMTVDNMPTLALWTDILISIRSVCSHISINYDKLGQCYMYLNFASAGWLLGVEWSIMSNPAKYELLLVMEGTIERNPRKNWGVIYQQD